ncbi:MAG: tetratricopeptide repeat protein [Planctomycetota bacterium]
MSRRERIEQMLRDDPGDPFLRYALAQEFVSEGNPEEALKAFDALLADEPEHVPSYFQKAKVLNEEGETDDAVATLRAGIAVARRVGDDHAAGEMGEFLELIA